MTSLSALIAQVELYDGSDTQTASEVLAGAAPVLAAALKDALETLEKIRHEAYVDFGLNLRMADETELDDFIDSFLERHKEKP